MMEHMAKPGPKDGELFALATEIDQALADHTQEAAVADSGPVAFGDSEVLDFILEACGNINTDPGICTLASADPRTRLKFCQCMSMALKILGAETRHFEARDNNEYAWLLESGSIIVVRHDPGN